MELNVMTISFSTFAAILINIDFTRPTFIQIALAVASYKPVTSVIAMQNCNSLWILHIIVLTKNISDMY